MPSPAGWRRPGPGGRARGRRLGRTVPWCQECDRFVTPTSLGNGGACPKCGNALDGGVDEEEFVPVPWHFKLLLVATVLYLGWRAVQGVAWVVAHV